jgi:uncharacterized repeat protein (TIGR01451 family)
MISTAVSEDFINPGETRTYTAQYLVKETDICSDIVNNATASAIDPCSSAVYDADTARVHITYNAAISLDKTSDKSGEEVDAGDTITYTYYVANEGNVNLTDVDIIDDKIETISYKSGDNNGDGWLNLSEVWEYEGIYDVDEADLCSDIVNTAIVRARDPCNRLVRSSSDTEVVKTSCNEMVCCENRSNIELINYGSQTAISLGNSNARNNIKIMSNEFGGQSRTIRQKAYLLHER